MADDIFTIPEMLRYRAEHDRDKKVFTFYDRNGLVGYLEPYEIYTLAGRFAYCLREWGFQAGDVIASGLPNSPERIVSDFGVIMAGCVLTNLQAVEKDGADFWNTANRCRCRGIIAVNREENVAHQLVASSLPKKSSSSGIYDVSIQQAPSINKVVLCNRVNGDRQNSLLDFLKDRDEKLTFQASCSPSNLAVLFGTSGSSGFSKLIPNSHENILESGRMFRAAEDVIYYTDRLMGWIGGFPFELLAFAGRRVTQDFFDQQNTGEPEALWNIITTAGCTGAAFLPDTLCELVDHFKTKPPKHKLNSITSTGQAMKKELMDAIGVLCHAVLVCYGSTEGGIFSADAITDKSHFKDFYCGKILPDVEIKLVDEGGNPVNNGEEGEIYLKCRRLLKQYYNAEQTSSKGTSSQANSTSIEAFTPDGWFRTGDRGVLQSDNSLYCYGRKGDVVSMGAILVYLSWPESILNKCPDIQNSSIVGVEDDKNGNVKLCACVKVKTGKSNMTERKIMEFFEGQMMVTGCKFQLKLSHVFFMDQLPLLPTGKTNKRKLKQDAIEKLKALQ